MKNLLMIWSLRRQNLHCVRKLALLMNLTLKKRSWVFNTNSACFFNKIKAQIAQINLSLNNRCLKILTHQLSSHRLIMEVTLIFKQLMSHVSTLLATNWRIKMIVVQVEYHQVKKSIQHLLMLKNEDNPNPLILKGIQY